MCKLHFISICRRKSIERPITKGSTGCSGGNYATFVDFLSSFCWFTSFFYRNFGLVDTMSLWPHQLVKKA